MPPITHSSPHLIAITGGLIAAVCLWWTLAYWVARAYAGQGLSPFGTAFDATDHEQV